MSKLRNSPLLTRLHPLLINHIKHHNDLITVVVVLDLLVHVVAEELVDVEVVEVEDKDVEAPNNANSGYSIAGLTVPEATEVTNVKILPQVIAH